MGRDAGRALQGGAAPFGGVHGATWTSASGPRSAREVTGRQSGHSGPPPDTRPGHRGQSAETAAKFEPRSPHSGADRRRPESVPAGFPSPAPCSTCCYPWPSGSERPSGTGSGQAWTEPRQRADQGQAAGAGLREAAGRPGLPRQRGLGQRGRPDLRGESAHQRAPSPCASSGASAPSPFASCCRQSAASPLSQKSPGS